MFFISHVDSKLHLSKIGRVLGAGVLALSLALVMDAALGMASAHANPITVTVAPDGPNGWMYLTETVSSGGPIPFDMVDVPPPPLGRGSARFVLTSAPVGKMLAAGLYGGTPLSAFTTLTYSAFLSTHVSAPALQLGIDFDGTDAAAGWQGRLVYAPTGLTNTWQVFDAQSGAFWFATQPPYNTLCSMGTPCTWSQVLTNWPNAAIHTNTVGGLGFIGLKAGSGFAAYTAYADALTVAANGSTTVFDFEPCSSVRNVDTDNRYCTIQSAIDAPTTLAGHTLFISPGEYIQPYITINKGITLTAAPNSATLRPAANHPDILAAGVITNGSLIWIAAPNVTLSNLILDGDNPSLSGGNPVNGADVNAVRGVHLRDVAHNNLTVENVTFRNLGRAIDVRSGANHRFEFNTIENIGGPDANYGYGVLVFNTAGVTARYNTLRDLSTAGLFVQNHFNTNPVIFGHNVITNASIALGVNLVYGGATYTVEHNRVYSTSLAMQITSIQIATLRVMHNAITMTQAGDYGLYVWNTWANTTHLLSNTVQGGYAPLWVSDLDISFGAGPAHVLAQGNVFAQANVGAGLESRAGGVTATLHNNTFINLAEAGVWVDAGVANRVQAVIGGAPDRANIFSGTPRTISVTAPFSNPTILATFNDWGVTGVDNIEASLHHQADDPTLANIRYFTLTLEAESPVPADGSGGAVTATVSGLLTPAPSTVTFAASLGNLNPATAATAPSTATSSFSAEVTGTATLTATVANVNVTTTVTLVDSPVQGFAFAPVGTQFTGEPFTVIITATDGLNQPVTSYSGLAVLTDTTQTLSPTLVGPFVNGVAVFSATVMQAITSTSLTASHPVLTGVVGNSNAFAVVTLQAENSSPTTLGSVTFFSATAAPGLAYVWDFGNGVTAAGALTTYTYPAVGSYTAMVTATNGAGSVSASTPVTITQAFGVQVAPTTVTQTVYPFQAVTFTVRLTNTGNGPDTYTLTLSSGGFTGTLSTASLPLAAGQGADVTITATAPGLLTMQTFQHTLTAQSSAPGVSATATLTLVVQPHRLFLPTVRR